MSENYDGTERRAEHKEIMPLLLEMREDQIKIKKILLGNGEIGLCEKVRDIEVNQIKSLRKEIEDIADSKRWIIRIVMSAFVLALIGLVLKK